MTFFKAEDFDVSSELKCGDGIGPVFAATLANEKLQRDAKVVYGQNDLPNILWLNSQLPDDTHRALLICVEKIERKPCEHEAKIMVGTDNCYVNECIHCGKEIKPTGWEVVND